MKKISAEQTMYNNIQINKYIANVEIMKGQLEAMKEYEVMKASLIRTKFNSLIEEGFTPEQALILCKDNLK